MGEARLDAVAASHLAGSAIQASFIALLNRKGLLTNAETVEIFERALLMIEQQQGASPHSQDIFSAARELIEQHLRPAPRP